jgi:hypothetical protein
MDRDTLRAMIRALPEVREDGNSLLFDPGWEVTLHAGGDGAAMSIQQVVRATLEQDFVVLETHKSQRVVLALALVRGLTADPSSVDRKSRRTGFM